MKKINLLFVLILIVITGLKSQFVIHTNDMANPPVDLSKYDIQDNESDEFNADTLILNPLPNSKWNDYVPWTPPGSIVWPKINNICPPRDQSTSTNPYCMNPNIVHRSEIINGQSISYLRLDTKYDTVYRPAPTFNTYGGCDPDSNYQYFNYLYTTATLSSIQLFKYGYFEINARYPSGGIADGPAYWYCCGNGIYSEIDVYEKAFTCNPYSNDITMSIHNGNLSGNCIQSSEYDYNNPCNSTIDNCGFNICDPFSIPTDPRLNFHTYGLDWEPDILRFYIDGTFIKQYTYLVEHINTPDCDNYGTYIPVNNLEMQGLILSNNLDNSVSSELLPKPGQDYFYDIDYIRVYKIKPSIECTSAFYTQGTFEFDAFQYKDFNNLVVDDNYTWFVQGGKIINYLDSPINSKAIIQIQDTTNLIISLTAKERSKNTSYFVPYRYSTTDTNINLIKTEILIFPNPGENDYNIITPTELLNDKNLELTIYNNLGETIEQIELKLPSSKIEFSLEGKSDGIYFVRLNNGINSYSGKLIKEMK